MRELPCLLGPLALLVACGGAQSSPEIPTSVSTWQSGPVTPDAHRPTATTLRRSIVRDVVAAGLPVFLRQVTLDDQPVLVDRKFHGFRLVALSNDSMWNGVDLRPGDVITDVNGMPIEHPEEAFAAFHALESAPELRVGYERDGARRELRYAIVDDDPPTRTGSNPPRTQVR